MSPSGLFGIGGDGTNSFQVNVSSASRNSGPYNFKLAAATESEPNPTIDQLRVRLLAASTALGDAFGTFRTETRPVYTTSVVSTAPGQGALSGLAARLTPRIDGYSVLRTLKINTQTSTDRSSSGALGLDVTSAAAASSLDSSAGLGLDVTSAQAESTLTSSATLGLDIASALTVSTLKSSAALGLDVTSAQSASTIRSTAEMNTATTSLSAYDLAFGGSTSHAQISGAYSGTATSLTVRITGAANISGSASLLSFNVTDQNNNQVGTYTGMVSAGQVLDVGSTGLKIRFTAGTLGLNANAATNVSQTGANVSATALFNAGWGSAPVFENYQTVSAGSFTINGTTIAVNANDSINSVIARINSSAAGVTAAVSGDRITLTTNSNSEDNIVLSSDTSGLLAATKLSGASTTRGNIRDDQQVLSKTTQFNSVTNGSFTVNGASISVNKDTDTLTSIMNRINGANAGVTASFDSAQGKLILATTSNSEDLITVTGDTTGFLTAAKLSTNNTVRGNIRDDQQVLAKTTQFGTVTNGSFSVNGVSISVNKNTDTLTSILNRINTSNAGVTASFDPAQDKLILTGTSNSEELITVAGDTTGFLAAAKLSTNNTVRGNIRDDQQVFAKTTQFSSVTNGSFSVNGVSISVNRNTDTLASILDRINNSSAGVTAAFNSSTNKIELTGTSNSEDLINVGSDTSGFLATANLNTGNTVRGNLADDQQVFSKTSQFASVTSGSFEINGVSISVDAEQDTLQTIIGKINGAGVGVTAGYDSGTDKLTFTPDVAGATLALENDTSGFLAAAQVATGTVGTHVNADAAFNASGLDSPLFDPGKAVQAGSFAINGVTITVGAGDTINTVLARITASDAGVTATFDNAAQTVQLISKQESTAAITLTGDTSGFLDAVKLDQTAASTTGTVVATPFDSAVSLMSEYSSVQSGAVMVNNHQIAIDPSTTTIRGLVSALNGIEGVSAKLNESGGKISISSRVSGGSITLSDTSGMLSTLGIATGSHRGTPGVTQVIETQTGTMNVSNESEVAQKVSAAADNLNEVLSQLGKITDSPSLRSDLETTLRRALDSLGDSGVHGLSLTATDGNLRVLVEGDKLAGSITGLLGGQDEAGVVAAVDRLLEDFKQQTATLAEPRPAEPPKRDPIVEAAETLKAQVAANQISTLLLLKAPQKTADAYSEKKSVFGESDRPGQVWG